MTVLPLCFSFCSNPVFPRHIIHDRLSNFAMRRRRPMKPSPVRQTGKVSGLKAVQRRPAVVAFALAAAVAAVGFLALRTARRVAARTEPAEGREEGYEGSGAKEKLSSHNGVGSAMAPVFSAEVVSEYDHDRDAFTQGLLWHEGSLYESTGLEGRSSIRRVELETGAVLAAHDLKKQDFGEGLAISGADGGNLVQVLWKTGRGYIYDRETMAMVSEFSFEGDGWGLASAAGKSDIMYLSDGTSTIRVYRLANGEFSKIREFTVHDGSQPVGLLNELEVLRGELWANVWFSDFVARIDPETGAVKSWVDLRGILKKSAIPRGHSVDVLNGIAYDAGSDRVFVTGKLWPKLFAIRVTDQKTADSITELGSAFFLDPVQVRYVHEHVIG